MTAVQWLELALLGGMLGAVGQAARAIIGLKKANDQAAAEDKQFKDVFEPARLFVSLVIGFVAGALAALLTIPEAASAEAGATLAAGNLELVNVLALVAAGYAGADFIEGIMHRFVPEKTEDAGVGTKTNDTQTVPTTPSANSPTVGSVAVAADSVG